MLGIALGRGIVSRDALCRETLPRHVMTLGRGTMSRQAQGGVLWSNDACVVANAQTASITTASSRELTWTCSGDCCEVWEGPAVSVGAGAAGGGDGGDESGTGLLSTSTSISETGSSPLGGSSTASSAASSYCWRITEIGLYRDRSKDKTCVHLILRLMRGSSGNPRCSRTWLSNLDINNGKTLARARPLRWTFSSKCNREVMTSSEGLNQNPSEILYRASSIAPLHCT